MLSFAARRIQLALLPFLVGIVSTVALVGCSDDDDDDGITNPTPTTGTVMFRFEHMVGSELLAMDQLKFDNAAGNLYEVENLEYYVSDFVLEGDQRIALDNVHYVSADDHDTHSFMVTDVPPGHYMSFQFVFGLDEEKNHDGLFGDQSDLPPHGSMQWPAIWGGGFHYMKLEGKVEGEGATLVGFSTHTGRYDDGDQGPFHHHVPVDLELHANMVAGETLVIEIVHDINEWYADPHVLDLEDHVAIMANQAEQDRLEANGASVFRLGDVSSGDDHEQEG